jgi:hypothetical protein
LWGADRSVEGGREEGKEGKEEKERKINRVFVGADR